MDDQVWCPCKSDECWGNVRSLSSGDELCCYTIICFYEKINVLIGGTPHKGRSYFSIAGGENNNKNILLENLFFLKSLVVLSQIARFCSSTMIFGGAADKSLQCLLDFIVNDKKRLLSSIVQKHL